MSLRANQAERRTEPRERSELTIRWKRPGAIEDQPGWTIDRSPSGIGFLVPTSYAPEHGELLHMRYWDLDRWAMMDRPLRVARVSPTAGLELMMVGCRSE